MNYKLFVITAVTLVFLIPPGLGIFNHYIGSRLLNLPYGLLGKDFPLESRMYLAKNYRGHSYRANINDGFEKTTYSTNEIGFRSPKVDFSKELVLVSGDSVLFGVGLNDWETVPYLFREKVDHSNKYSIVNAATPGKSIAHHLLTLQYFLALSKRQNSRIKYMILGISFNDFEEDISLELIQNRALKQNLALKDQLAVSFPSLAIFYKTLRDRTIGRPIRQVIGSALTQKRSRRYARISQNEPGQTRRFFSDSKVINKNLRHFQDLLDLCNTHGIVLINLITVHTYNDIFYEESFSDYLNEMLRGLGQKHILAIKDIYHSQPEIYPYISKRGYDFGHFSNKAAQLIADKLAYYVDKLEIS
jgi:lysophospholipase L1-like esterase